MSPHQFVYALNLFLCKEASIVIISGLRMEIYSVCVLPGIFQG